MKVLSIFVVMGASVILGCSMMPVTRRDESKYNRDSKSIVLCGYDWLKYDEKGDESRIVYGDNYTCKLMRAENEDLYRNYMCKKLIKKISRIPVDRIVINEIIINNSDPTVTLAYVDYFVKSYPKYGKLIFCFSDMYDDWIAIYSNAY